ncbi:phosphoglycerate mutase family protein [Aliiglaciecola sp. CAU 1673]|uniref:SixA phosphatase family protein n=1 Tax=Aliiglaciecola sp. CAU 1673 TaxID=3032595 RepID=UPI0023DAF9BB|nr:phosphoglycerate mutase family protein [Aliiglaciecola sp. CAU 1673]MDF2178939.1 phosphoglycerate mutase family protein [Aliiglaciecola sp. CAU 1673]
MKTWLLCLFLFLSASGSALAADVSLYFLRHAQKESQGSDPALTEAGKHQAQNLATMLKHVPLERIYSTDYQRTRQTVTPLAESKEMEVLLYDPRDLEGFAASLLANGQDAVIVGHSNTTPELIRLLGGEAADIQESEYGDLYRLHLDDKKVETLRLVIPH